MDFRIWDHKMRSEEGEISLPSSHSPPSDAKPGVHSKSAAPGAGTATAAAGLGFGWPAVQLVARETGTLWLAPQSALALVGSLMVQNSAMALLAMARLTSQKLH